MGHRPRSLSHHELHSVGAECELFLKMTAGRLLVLTGKTGLPIMTVESEVSYFSHPMAKFIKQRLRKPLIWLLLPVALLTGRPMVGCVCSDGAYKVSCEKLVGNFVWPQATEKQGTSCCPASNSSSCPSCHPSSEENNHGVSAESRCVCRGIQNHLKLTSSTNLDRERHISFAPLNVDVDCAPSLVALELRSPLHSDLPPPNRVVLFLHLTI